MTFRLERSWSYRSRFLAATLCFLGFLLMRACLGYRAPPGVVSPTAFVLLIVAFQIIGLPIFFGFGSSLLRIISSYLIAVSLFIFSLTLLLS